MAKTKDSSKVRDSWKQQPRSKGGKFLPKDAHPEDVKLVDDRVFYSPMEEAPSWTVNYSPLRPAVRPSKGRKRIILGYVGYVALCFVAGALGAYLGAKL